MNYLLFRKLLRFFYRGVFNFVKVIEGSFVSFQDSFINICDLVIARLIHFNNKSVTFIRLIGSRQLLNRRSINGRVLFVRVVVEGEEFFRFRVLTHPASFG